MALRGTLRDFGIADIFQLISHQNKTGILTVRSGSLQVLVYFVNGNVARAESTTRKKRELLGAMLVRSELISDKQLNDALELQKMSKQRIGDILVQGGAIERKNLKLFARLQTSETLYQLFLWSTGTYDFAQLEPGAIQAEADTEVIRSESVLMEGFRQLDEWPMIRKHITSYGMTFDKLEDLDAVVAAEATEEELGFEDPFVELEGKPAGGQPNRMRNVGQNERVIYQLLNPERDVQKLIDLSRIGEFETCKSLAMLIEAGIIRTSPERVKKPSADATVGGIHAGARLNWAPFFMRAGIGIAAIVGLCIAARSFGIGARLMPAGELGSFVNLPTVGYLDLGLARLAGTGQVQKIRYALATFEAENGRFPPNLDELVRCHLLTRRDLRFPYEQPYYYVSHDGTYDLLQPLF